MKPSTARLLTIMMLVALGLTACGKRSNLEPPPGAVAQPKVAKGETAPDKPHEPFILDALLY
jgi:predicted small lipoprotein YifL